MPPSVKFIRFSPAVVAAAAAILFTGTLTLLADDAATTRQAAPTTRSAASQPATSQPVVHYVPPPVVHVMAHGKGNVPSPGSVEELLAIQEQVEKVLPSIMPATVGIAVGAAQGSGVIVTPDGYILTAGHVSVKADQVCTLIMPDGKRVKGITLGANHFADSGMIKITDKPPTAAGWPFVKLGTSSDLQMGEWAIALGHPGGYRVGRPPVVRLGRIIHNDLSPTGKITTDDTLVGGDSGGPLFDLAGHLIGINQSIAPSTSQNMHVPVDVYVAQWDGLAHGQVLGHSAEEPPAFNVPAPPHMGVGVDELPNNAGLRLTRVDAGSPADKAGLRIGDEVYRINNQPVRNTNEMLQVLLQQRSGNVINVYVHRPDAEDQMLRIKLATAPPRQGR